MPPESDNQNFTNAGPGGAAVRFSPGKRTRRPVKRTLPPRLSFFEDCDILAYSCLKGYLTGMVCARTIYQHYQTFSSYCAMDYQNCIERQNVWHLIFMGECSKTNEQLPGMSDYIPYPYIDDYHLDMYYVDEEH